MAVILAAVLPECPACDRPMRRADAGRHGGLCPSCAVTSPRALALASARERGNPDRAR